MVRFVIIGIVIAVAFTLYALVDAAMTDSSRARGVAKPVWVVLIVVLPVIGAALWFLIGKGQEAVPSRAPQAPDDDPRFTGRQMPRDQLDDHMKDLEARLRELDDEVFPGEGSAQAPPARPSGGSGSGSAPSRPAAGHDADAGDRGHEDPTDPGDTDRGEAREHPGKRGPRPDGDAPRP
ncbi:PLDc N-terminal domain-containing protein [Leucobacter sp. CSA2]|uniref:PLDc N-terminal domain-containing protein n=1 Tax=Leucobacter edaphi TaxID=2796472 RepID=A0A934QF86_9MICO|nr:PLDc N-terminal domain-containing protein [Leucobacter edaphi]MBK0422227.1 PLDc N-terminal domain-containing protein [Leucobacter edaphi]